MREHRDTLGVIGDEFAVELSGQLAMLDRIGWVGLELRSIGGRMIGQLSDADFAVVQSTIAESRVSVLAVDSNIGGWGRSIATDFADDLRELERLAPRALALSTKRLRIMSWQNDGRSQDEWGRAARQRIAAITRRAELLGVELVHENCAGWGGQGPEQARQLLDHAASESLRLLFDTGNGLTYGYDASAYLEPLSDAVVHVHVKDGRAEPQSVRHLHPGAGDAGLAECIDLLLDAGYDGPWVLEPHFLIAPHSGHLSASPAPDGSHVALESAAATFEELLNDVRASRSRQAQG